MNKEEIRRLDSYLYIYLKVILNTKGYNKLKEEIYKILNCEVIVNLNYYSREILKLALEKRIILSIEKYNLKSKNPIDLRRIDNENIKNYINLFIHEFNNVPSKDEFLATKEFFNQEIIKESLKLMSDSLVSKQNYIDKILETFNNLFKIKSSYKTDQNIKIKKSILLSFLIPAISMAILTNSFIIEDEVEIDIDNELEKDIVEDIFKEKITAAKVFLGYDNDCPKEYQEYIYKISNKYGIPFNIFMSIIDIESDGKFDNNEKVSSTSDYGFCQINIYNHDYIYENLGYTSEDLLKDPYKNIEAAAFLLGNICSNNEEEISQNNPENVFGTYNGWTNWRDKETSINYVLKAMYLYNYVYNKDDDELFEIITKKINIKQ